MLGFYPERDSKCTFVWLIPACEFARGNWGRMESPTYDALAFIPLWQRPKRSDYGRMIELRKRRKLRQGNFGSRHVKDDVLCYASLPIG